MFERVTVEIETPWKPFSSRQLTTAFSECQFELLPTQTSAIYIGPCWPRRFIFSIYRRMKLCNSISLNVTDLHSLAIQLFFQTSQFILVLKIHLTYHPTTNPFNLYISISTLTRTTYFFRQKQVQFVLALQLYKWVDFPPYWIHWHTVLGLGTFTWSIGNQGVKLVFIGIILAK